MLYVPLNSSKSRAAQKVVFFRLLSKLHPTISDKHKLLTISNSGHQIT